MAFTDGSTVAFTVAGVTYRYNLSSSQGVSGIWTVQNVTPTFTQAKAGQAVDNDVQPFAEESFSDWTGSFGLNESTNDPGDSTRPFFSTLDTSKARQLTGAPVLNTAATLFATNLDTTGTLFAWVNSTSGPGLVALRTGATYAYWRWNEATAAWDLQRNVTSAPMTGNPSGATNRAVAGSMHQPFQTVVQYGTALWMSSGLGLSNINIAAAAPAGAGAILNLAATCRYFDQLVTFSVNNGNLEVICLNDSAGDATLTRTLSIDANGNTFNNICKIYGESVVMGVVPLAGSLFVFTDKSLYTLQWIEATNVFVVEPIIQDTARFTSNPCVFQGELYCGSDNQLWHWTPGQQNPDFKPIDPDGWLPAPYNGRITELHPYSQVLGVKVVNRTGTIASVGFRGEDWVILRFTTLGAWQFLAHPPNETFSGVNTPALKTQDGTNFSGIQTLKTASTTQPWAVFESGQNMRTVSSGIAYTSSGFHVTPWRYGTNRTAQRQLLRARWEVEQTDVAGQANFRAYFQTDTANRATDSPVFGSTGLGTWTRATPDMKAATTGDASSVLDSTGTGVLWTEYDGTNGSDWHGSTAYPTYKRIRWLYQIINGTSAAYTAALLSHSYQYLEYAFKFYVINCTLHLEINQDHPNNPTSALTSPTLLMAEVSRIQGWDYGKNIITVVGPDNVTYPSVITKYLANVTKIQPNGVWSVDVALTLQCVKLFGLAI